MGRIKKELCAFSYTFSFFSRIRTPTCEFDEEIFRLSLKYIPLFALISAGILYIFFHAISYMIPDKFILALATISLQYFLFNYFHFDGLLDTADAFLSSEKNKDEILNIMSDPHPGAFAILTGILYIAVKIYLYFSVVVPSPIMIVPTLFVGRISMLLCAFFFPHAKESGLGSLFIMSAKAKGNFLPILSILFPIYFFPVETIVSTIIVVLFSLYSLRVIGGLTGDVLGSICEIAEISFLLLFLIKNQ